MGVKGWKGGGLRNRVQELGERPYFSHFQNSTHCTKHLVPLKRAAAGDRLGTARPGVQGDAESSRVPHTPRAYHDHHFGSGALNLPLYDAKSLAVHFRVPRDGGGVRRGFPTPETCGTSFRNAEVWLPWCAMHREGQVGGAEVGPVTMVTIDAGARNFLPEPRS